MAAGVAGARSARTGEHWRGRVLAGPLGGCLVPSCRTPPSPPEEPPPAPAVEPATPPAPAPATTTARPSPTPPARPAPRVFTPEGDHTQLTSYHLSLKGEELDAPPSRMSQVFPERYTEAAGVFTFRGGPLAHRRRLGHLSHARAQAASASGRSTPPEACRPGSAAPGGRVSPSSSSGRTSSGTPWAAWAAAAWRRASSRSSRARSTAPCTSWISRTGKPTRPPINTGNPIKGSVSLDPRGYPLLFVGQGIPRKKNAIGLHVYDLITHKEVFFLPGKDKASPRSWGAFDSSGLLNRTTDSYLLGGENGLLYALKLNTDFDSIKLRSRSAPRCCATATPPRAPRTTASRTRSP